MLKTFTMPNDFYTMYMSNVSDPLYDDLNKTSDCWKKLPCTQIGGEIKLPLLIVLLKILMISWERIVHMALWLFQWGFGGKLLLWWLLLCNYTPRGIQQYAWALSSYEQKITSRKKGGFKFNYSTEQRRIYITNLFENKRTFLNEHLCEAPSFKDHNIKAKNLSGKDQVIYTDSAPGFSSDNCIFLYASFVKTSRVDNTNVALLIILERKNSHKHIHNYNIKRLQCISVNTSYLELGRLTLRGEFGDPLELTKGNTVIQVQVFISTFTNK